MGSHTMDVEQAQHVDWSRYCVDLTVEGSSSAGLKLSLVDLRILVTLMRRPVLDGDVCDGSRNLQNLRSVFVSMMQHLERKQQ